jgi:alkanesulfonate monooxygenase SsuD/methylene tetrahydromethanopterin reductase-like flavin-dependent oxidoreductase (luciferase family)
MRNLPVKLGLSLPNRGPLFGLTTVDALLEAAVLAEESGVFDSVWFGDGLIDRSRYESVVMLSAVAARTRRVRLGTACMASFPVRHPVLLGIQWATLDQLSKGRTILCVCNGGGQERELKVFGAQRNERVPRLVEGIRLLRAMWNDGEGNYKGRFYSLEGCNIEPKPSQRPCPIWIAVSPDKKSVGEPGVEKAMRRVVQLADGYMIAGHIKEFPELWKGLKAAAQEMGKSLDTFETAVHGMVNINDDKQAAYQESRFYFDHYYRPGFAEGWLSLWLAHGSPEECAAIIQAWIDMGITTPILRFTSRNQVAQVRRFIEDVLPLLRMHGGK